jgi:acetyltransferase-like isoleucine patch superfamily enzyme
MISKHAVIGKGTKLWYPELSNIGACTIDEDCTIHSHVWIADGVTIGKRVKIEAFAFIPPGVTIEDDCFIGPHVCFTNDKELEMAKGWQPIPTVVEHGAKIGANATIVAGVIIHQCAVIGAGSVVTHNVPEFCVAYGNPARVRRLT